MKAKKTGLVTVGSLLNYNHEPMLWRVTIGTDIDTPNGIRWRFYVVAGDIVEAALMAEKITKDDEERDTILEIVDASDGDGLSMIWFDTGRIDVDAMKTWINTHHP